MRGQGDGHDDNGSGGGADEVVVMKARKYIYTNN
jgi:hypothetical protein